VLHSNSAIDSPNLRENAAVIGILTSRKPAEKSKGLFSGIARMPLYTHPGVLLQK
jgi:hypothetical protein